MKGVSPLSVSIARSASPANQYECATLVRMFGSSRCTFS